METVKRVILGGAERVARTPPRKKTAAVVYRRAEAGGRSRRSLSFASGEISDVSPLSSASSGLYSPPPPSTASPHTPDTPSKAMTPLKGNFAQLLICQDSPEGVLETPRRRSSPRVKGVSPLKDGSRGIPAKSFYGPNAIRIPEDRSKIYSVVHAHVLESARRVRTRLALEGLLANRKRVRSGGCGGSGRPHKKSRKSLEKEKLLQAPRLTPGSPLRRRRRPKTPRTAPPRLKKEKTEKKTAPCNWEIFYSPSEGPRKFFKKRPKLSLNESLLTPPSSQKKQRKLLNTTVPHVYLSPEKSEYASDDEGPLTAEVMDDLLSVLESPTKSSPPSEESSESSSEEDAAPVEEVEAAEGRYFPVFTGSTPVRQRGEAARAAPRRILGHGADQYQIDAGQSGLCETHCSSCGLLYSKGDPDDEKEHTKYHNNYNQLRFKGWKNEKVVGSFEGRDRVVCVDRYDPKSWWRKAETVVQIVDKELGFPEQPLDYLKFPKVYLYVKERTVVGCLVAERAAAGHRLLSGEAGLDICSEEQFPVKCGVNRIWVHHLHRRAGIASRLIDTLRRTFVFGCILRAEDLAFTIPTESGKKLISRYSGTEEFLVYIYQWPRYD